MADIKLASVPTTTTSSTSSSFVDVCAKTGATAKEIKKIRLNKFFIIFSIICMHEL